MGRQSFDEHSLRRMVRSILRSERELQNPVSPLPLPDDAVNQTWWPYRNDFAGEVPAHGVIAIRGTVEIPKLKARIYKADRPDTTFRRRYAISWGMPVPEGGRGLCTFTGPAVIAHDASWNPLNGQAGGPKPGSFLLFQNYPSTTFVDDKWDADGDLLVGSLALIDGFIAKTTAAWTGPKTDNDYKIQKGNLGSEADAGYTTVPNGRTIEDFSNNKLITGTYRNGLVYLEPFECQ